MKKLKKIITSAFLLASILIIQFASPIRALAANTKNYANNDQIQVIDGYTVCHLRDDGWCGCTYMDGDNVNFEALAGLNVHCNKTTVDYTMYRHNTRFNDGNVTIRKGSTSVNLGAIKYDETKSFDLKAIISQMDIKKTNGIYILSLKLEPYKTPVDILLYYNGSKVQTCWNTECSQYSLGRWNSVIGKLDPNKCLNLWVGNKSNPITYPTSGTEGACNHVQEWCDLSDKIIKIPEWSDEEKVYALVCYLTLNYAYDDYRVSTLNNVSRANKDDAWTDDNHFMYYNKVGQCWDFANVLTIMCRHHGIPCTSVENEGHTINAVWMNGEWIGIDVSALVEHHCDTEDTDPKNWKEYSTGSYSQYYGYYDGNMVTYNQALATPETTLTGKSGKNPM